MDRAGPFLQWVAVIDPVLGRVGADHPQLDAALLGLALPGHVHLRWPLSDDRAAGLAVPLHREDVAPAPQPGELIHLIGVVAA
ncbi:hypothetical protein D9M69_475600 [compost metagenome]